MSPLEAGNSEHSGASGQGVEGILITRNGLGSSDVVDGSGGDGTVCWTVSPRIRCFGGVEGG